MNDPTTAPESPKPSYSVLLLRGADRPECIRPVLYPLEMSDAHAERVAREVLQRLRREEPEYTDVDVYRALAENGFIEPVRITQGPVWD